MSPHCTGFADALRRLARGEAGEPLCDLVVDPLRQGRPAPRVLDRPPKAYAYIDRPPCRGKRG